MPKNVACFKEDGLMPGTFSGQLLDAGYIPTSQWLWSLAGRVLCWWSNCPLVRWPIGTKTHRSDGPLVQNSVIGPTALRSDSLVWKSLIGSTTHSFMLCSFFSAGRQTCPVDLSTMLLHGINFSIAKKLQNINNKSINDAVLIRVRQTSSRTKYGSV